MEHLLGKRLLIFAGKGGVGKTTCSSAMALALARTGRKTLLVTVDPAKRLKDALAMDVDFKPTPVQPNLWAMMLDPEKVIREHLQREVPEAGVTEHPLFQYVTNYLPGLNELMAIGQLNDLRAAGEYDCIVVDTAPTGHALSFLWAPKAIQELMSERSILKWAIRGYQVWQQVTGTARRVGGLLKKKEERKEPPPNIDFERIFGDIQEEATKIRAFLTDQEHSAMVLVTLPEKLPVEETCELHSTVTQELGMQVGGIVINKVQPDPLGAQGDAFASIVDDPQARAAFVTAAAKGAGVAKGLVEALVSAAEFADVRRRMNISHIRDLHRRLPDATMVEVPLFRSDVQGLKRLGRFRDALFPA